MEDHIQTSIIDDDDLDDQEIFIMCVQNLERNVDCRTVNNGAKALAMLNTHPGYIPGYIFLDVNLPKMNGIECLKNLRKIDRLTGTIIYVYSTTAESTALEDIKNFGAVEFIIKPAKITASTETLLNILLHLREEIHVHKPS